MFKAVGWDAEGTQQETLGGFSKWKEKLLLNEKGERDIQEGEKHEQRWGSNSTRDLPQQSDANQRLSISVKLDKSNMQVCFPCTVFISLIPSGNLN